LFHRAHINVRMRQFEGISTPDGHRAKKNKEAQVEVQ
jgi:hypothetical protein